MTRREQMQYREILYTFILGASNANSCLRVMLIRAWIKHSSHINEMFTNYIEEDGEK
jgi:hypothetical protein